MKPTNVCREGGYVGPEVHITGTLSIETPLHNQKVCSVESLPTDDVLDEPADTALRILSM